MLVQWLDPETALTSFAAKSIIAGTCRGWVNGE